MTQPKKFSLGKSILDNLGRAVFVGVALWMVSEINKDEMTQEEYLTILDACESNPAYVGKVMECVTLKVRGLK